MSILVARYRRQRPDGWLFESLNPPFALLSWALFKWSKSFSLAHYFGWGLGSSPGLLVAGSGPGSGWPSPSWTFFWLIDNHF